MNVVIRYFDGCPNWLIAEARLRSVLDEAGRGDIPIRRERVETAEDAERLAFRGSPSILIDGVDPYPTEDAPSGLACRRYGDEGAPSVESLRDAVAASS